MRERVEKYLTSRPAKYLLNTAGVLYLLAWGLQYSAPAMAAFKSELILATNILNGVFFIELSLRVYVYRKQAFKQLFTIKIPDKRLPKKQERVH